MALLILASFFALSTNVCYHKNSGNSKQFVSQITSGSFLVFLQYMLI